MGEIHIGSMASVVDDNNVLWMSNVFFNGLFRMDLNSLELCCVGAFEGADISAGELHKGAHINGKEIIFTPFYDQAVRIYHTDSNTYQTIAIPEEHKPPFSESVRVGQNIFFLSEDGCIWNYDIDKHSLTIDELSKDYKKFLDVTGGASKQVVSDGFLLLKRGETLMCRIDLEKHKTEIIHINGNMTDLQVALYGQGLYWFFLLDSQDIVSWNREKSEFIRYKCKEEKWGKNNFKSVPYAKMMFVEDTAWISNYNAMSPVQIDKDKKSIEPIVEGLDRFRVINPGIWGPLYPNVHIAGQDFYFIPCHANLLLQYNRETGEHKTIEMVIPQEQIPYFNEIVKDALKNEATGEREEIFTLREFIECVKENGIDNSSMEEKEHRKCGELIWKNSIEC